MVHPAASFYPLGVLMKKTLISLFVLTLASTASAQNLLDFPDHTIRDESYDYIFPGWRLFAWTDSTQSFPSAGTYTPAEGIQPRNLTSHYVEIMSWDNDILTIGGNRGYLHESTQVIRYDADWKHSIYLDGRAVMKIEDHPTTGAPIMHLTDIARVWMANTNRQDVVWSYQGAAGGEDGWQFLIGGQNANGAPGQESISGGDMIIRAGDANPAIGSPETIATPGNINLRGGRVGGSHQGNIALGNEPIDYLDARGAVFIDEVHTRPQFSSPTTQGGVFFVENGALYYQGGAGTVTLLAPP